MTPAFVEQAATARGGDTLAAALRLRVCESAAGWLEQTMRTSSLASTLFPLGSTPPPLASLRERLLKRCTALLADPTLSAEEVHEQLAATLLLAPKPAAELASGFFDVRVAAARRAAASDKKHDNSAPAAVASLHALQRILDASHPSRLPLLNPSKATTTEEAVDVISAEGALLKGCCTPTDILPATFDVFKSSTAPASAAPGLPPLPTTLLSRPQAGKADAAATEASAELEKAVEEAAGSVLAKAAFSGHMPNVIRQLSDDKASSAAAAESSSTDAGATWERILTTSSRPL